MVVDVSALTTDFYELTMMQGYYLNGENPDVVFDMFYRANPFNGGYAVFAGLGELLPQLESLNFSANDIAYLKSLNIFDQRFLDYLSTYRFKGEIYDYDYEMTARDHKLERIFFDFGGFERPFKGLRIGPDCIGCGTCMANCTFKAISFGEDGVYRIDPGRCDACGTCRHNCPAGAVEVFQ